MMHKITIWIVVAVISSSAAWSVTAVRAQLPRARSPWQVEPLRIGELTERDRTARESFLKLVDEEQEAEYRRHYRVMVAEMPSGLPDDYDVVIYGQCAGIALLRLEANVRGRHARGEMVTVDGFRRGELPADQVDDLVRQAVYAFLAEETSRSGEMAAAPSSRYASYQTHTRHQRLEIISRDAIMPLHLHTEAWQAIADTVSDRTRGVRGFAHTQLCTHLERLARRQLPLQEPSRASGNEVVERLRRIQVGDVAVDGSPRAGREDSAPEPSTAGTTRQVLALDDYRRDDLASIEAQLYSRLAVEWALKEALPELHRLKLDDTAARLEIAIADDPVPLLQAAITGEDFGLFQWSLEFVPRLPASQQRAVLLNSLARAPGGYRVRSLLEQLRNVEISEEETDTVVAFYRAASDLRSKIAAASFLLDRGKQESYYEFLMCEALRPQARQDDIYAPQRDAVRAIIRHASEHGQRRQSAAAMIRTLLKRIPMDAHADYSGMRTLVSALGAIGDDSDLQLLERYCEHNDASMVDSAIHTISRMDPKLSLDKAQEQIRRYLRGRGRNPSFGWYVGSYLDLIFWQDDQSAAGLLQQALQKFRSELRGEDARVTHTRLLLDYLRARGTEQRTKAALAYANARRIDQAWLRDVGQRLVRSGADPAQCAPLLEPDPDHWSRRWGSSREGRPW
jgi:hypothetical protein